jgi:hypothetical protein
LPPHALPPGHVGEHAGATHLPLGQTPDAQSEDAPHALPSGHVGEHAGAAHVPLAHTPDPQSPFPRHALPAGQVGAHASPHWPLEHDKPVPQLLPQVPQFSPSFAVSTQRPLQSVAVVPEQLAAQLPLEQCCPAAHTVSQAPQFTGSKLVSAQYAFAPTPHVA